MERDGLCMWSSGDSINFGQLSWRPPPHPVYLYYTYNIAEQLGRWCCEAEGVHPGRCESRCNCRCCRNLGLCYRESINREATRGEEHGRTDPG